MSTSAPGVKEEQTRDDGSRSGGEDWSHGELVDDGIVKRSATVEATTRLGRSGGRPAFDGAYERSPAPD